MKLLTFLARPTCVAACALATLSAHAGIITYNSQAAFLAATLSQDIDSFDNLPQGALDGPLARSAGGWTYSAAVDGGFYGIGTAADAWLSTNQALPITFSLFSPGVGAVGGFFFATDIDGAVLDTESISLTATDADGSITELVVNPSATNFVGFISSTGSLLELRVGVVDTGFNNAWVTVNDLTLAAVPEPTSVALVFAGLAGVAASTRRHNPNSRPT